MLAVSLKADLTIAKKSAADLCDECNALRTERGQLLQNTARVAELESELLETRKRHDDFTSRVKLLVDDMFTELHNWSTMDTTLFLLGFRFLFSGGKEGKEFQTTPIRDTDAAQRKARKTRLLKLVGLNSHGQRPKRQKGKGKPKG